MYIFIKNIIKMSLMEMLGEKKAPEKHLCGYLQMAQQRYGEFSDINLPEGVTPEDLENSDIKKMQNSLKPVDKWYIKKVLRGDFSFFLSNYDQGRNVVKKNLIPS